MSIIAPLPHKDLSDLEDWQQRVLLFDPTEMFARLKLNHFARHPKTSLLDMFPAQKPFCSCGCGEKLTGRRSRWATDKCQYFAVDCYFIVQGRTVVIEQYLNRYYQNDRCVKHDKNGTDNKTYITYVDHIIPVKHGGGGCWLSNYQFLCHKCHCLKTNEDFGWKAKAKKLPKSLISQQKLFT